MCVCKFSDHVFEYIAIVAVWLHALFLKLPLWQSMVPVHLVVSMSQLSSWTVFLGRSCDAIARLRSKWRMCHWKIPFEKSHFATAPCPVSRPHLFPGCGCVHEPLLIAVKCIVSVFRCCAVRSPRRPFEMSHCCTLRIRYWKNSIPVLKKNQVQYYWKSSGSEAWKSMPWSILILVWYWFGIDPDIGLILIAISIWYWSGYGLASLI